MNSLRFDTMSLPMFILLLFVIGIIIFLLIIEPRVSKKKLQNKNEHGSSKFATFEEIVKTFDKEDIKNIDNVGLPVYYEKDKNGFKNIYFDTKSPHYILIGSTGSGKSVTVSIPLSIHFATAKEKHSVVITDPKGELFRSTGRIFKDNGYNVITIDFRNPTKSNRINIMQPIIDEWKEYCKYNKTMLFLFSHFIKVNRIKVDEIDDKTYLNRIKNKFNLEEYLLDILLNNTKKIQSNIENKKMYDIDLFDLQVDSLKEFLDSKSNDEILFMIREYQNKSSKHQAEANRLVISLANLIFTEKEAKDPFWINSAKQLFIGITGIFLEDYQEGLIGENKINISSIKKFQNSSLIKENQNFLQSNLNRRNYGSLSKDYLISILSSAENTYKSITAVFGEKMSIFDDLNVENITGISEFSFTGIGKQPSALFIIVPDEDRSYFQLVTIIIGMLIKDLTKFANLPENNGKLPIKVEWILEEFANCPPVDSIEATISVARGRGMRFFLFIQSFGQLNQVYGKEIANIMVDNCALQYLKTNSVECAEIIAKKLGKSTVETNSMSMSTDPFKMGANQTKSLMGKELLTATEVIALKYKTIIFPIFGNPIFRDTYLYSDIYPEYKDYPLLERKVSALKRLFGNYYTVEKMREYYEKESNNETSKMIMEMEKLYEQQINKERKKLSTNLSHKTINNNQLEQMLLEIRNLFKNRIAEETFNNDICTFEIMGIINKFDKVRLDEIKKDFTVFEIAKNDSNKKTILSVWLQSLEMKGI